MKPTSTCSRLLLSTLCLLGLLLAGVSCGGYVVVPTADPNDPLRGARSFVLEPAVYGNLMVGNKPEPVYLAGKDDHQRQSWEADKAEAARIYTETLAGMLARTGASVVPPPPPGPGFFILRPIITAIEPGNFNGFFNIPTQMRMELQVFSPQAQGVGDQPFAVQIPASLVNPSSGGRMRDAGSALGDQSARYLLHRMGF